MYPFLVNLYEINLSCTAYYLIRCPRKLTVQLGFQEMPRADRDIYSGCFEKKFQTGKNGEKEKKKEKREEKKGTVVKKWEIS